MIKKIQKNKKAIIFTLLALVLSSMFILILTTGTTMRVDDGVELAKVRAGLFSSYHDSFVAYSSYALEIAAKACLQSVSQHMTNNNVFYPTEEKVLNDIAGCMNDSYSVYFGIGLGSAENLTVPVLLDQFVKLTEEDYGIYTNYTLTNIELSKLTANRLKITADIKTVIYDSTTSLNLPETQLISDADYGGVVDPYYNNNINDFRVIRKVSIIGESMEPYIGLDFQDFLTKVDYVEYTEIGISAIDRFLNKTNSASSGLISFINDSSLIPYSNHSSWVDFHIVNKTYFDCSKLYCYDSNCGAGDFALDSDTFLALWVMYNLNITDWDTKCE